MSGRHGSTRALFGRATGDCFMKAYYGTGLQYCYSVAERAVLC